MALGRRKPVKPIEQNKLITFTDPKSPISEQYRTIRTNIQFSYIDEELQTLLITSSGPGEGKSTSSSNMAVVFAQQGKRTLLIDADLRKPTCHYVFSETNMTGLTSVLTKQLRFDQAIKQTKTDNLSILTSGPIPPNPAELLSSNSMKDLLEEAKQSFDMIIIDTPPVTAVTDAQILADLCQGIILVVSSGRTEREAASKAKELLMHAKGKILGVILNNKQMKDTQYYYYYGK